MDIMANPIGNNQFDFSKYNEGFREYQKQKRFSLPLEPETMEVSSNLPGIGNLNLNNTKQLVEYLSMVAPDYYDQYISANKRNNPFWGRPSGDINFLQQTENFVLDNGQFDFDKYTNQTENVPSATNITPIGDGGSMGSINANNATNYNSLLQPQFPAQSIFNTINPANNQIQSSQQNGISQTLQPISQAQPYQLPPVPQPVSAPPRIAVPEASSLPKISNIDFAPQPGMPGYAPAFQPSSPYSATNLPEFMKDYQQTPSGKFVMNQGILGMPPQIDKVQSLFSQGYAKEYQPLEQKFQESFAFDPTMFGDMYRAGQLVPSVPMPTVDQGPGLNPALALAGAGAIKELYPYAEDFVKGLIPDSVPQPEPYGPPEQTFAQKFEEKVTQPVKAAIIDPVVAGWQESDLKKNIDQAYTTQKEFVRDNGLRDIETSVKNFISAADEKFDKPEWLNNLQEKVLPSGKTAFELYGNIENFAKDPTPDAVFKVTDSIQELNTFLPEGMQIKLPGGIVGGVADASAGLAVVEALKEPTVENLTQAYGAADHIATNYGDVVGINGLPGADVIGNVGAIIAGIKAAEGGIDSAGEAISVANAAALATSWATKGAAAGTAAATAGTVAGAVSSALTPLTAAIALEQILAEDMSVKDVLQSLPEVGRWFGGGGSTFGTATLKYDENNNDFVFGSEKSKKGGWQYTMPEMHATNLVLNELTNNLGFEVDQDKLKDVNTTIDIDNGNPVRASNDIVLDMINAGAIKPTANTPNDIDWGNLFTKAREYSAGYTDKASPGVSIAHAEFKKNNPIDYSTDFLSLGHMWNKEANKPMSFDFASFNTNPELAIFNPGFQIGSPF